jgi:hypothetical protein
MILEEIRSEVAKLPTTPKDLRKFAITMAVVLGLLSILTWYKESWSFPYLLGLTVAFLGFGFLKPTLLKPVYIGWMTLAIFLGFFMTRIILSVLYYSVFSIGGLIIRITGKDMLDERYEADADTYWRPYVKPEDPKQRLERQF